MEAQVDDSQNGQDAANDAEEDMLATGKRKPLRPGRTGQKKYARVMNEPVADKLLLLFAIDVAHNL